MDYSLDSGVCSAVPCPLQAFPGQGLWERVLGWAVFLWLGYEKTFRKALTFLYSCVVMPYAPLVQILWFPGEEAWP